jgi:hypothetical protein
LQITRATIATRTSPVEKTRGVMKQTYRDDNQSVALIAHLPGSITRQ